MITHCAMVERCLLCVGASHAERSIGGVRGEVAEVGAAGGPAGLTRTPATATTMRPRRSHHTTTLPATDVSTPRGTRRARGRQSSVVAALPLAMTLVVATSAFANAAPATTTVPFTTVGSSTWIVPAGVTSVSVMVAGARGGSSAGGGAAGSGGSVVKGDVRVTPGETLTVTVAGAGADGAADRTAGQAGAGFASGGPGGSGGTIGSLHRSGGGGGGGGGASAIVRAGLPLVVAGGGGGGGGAGSRSGPAVTQLP